MRKQVQFACNPYNEKRWWNELQTQKELGHNMEFEYDDISDDDLEKELKALEEEAIKGMKTVKNKKISVNKNAAFSN